MTKKITRCSVCGEKVIEKKITYNQELGGKIFLIENVPALVCSQCGEIYLSPDTVDAIQNIVAKGKAKEIIKVPVFHYSS